MSGILFSLPELYNSYKVWVSKNPQLASDVESTVKWISYFIAGRVNNSNVLSELVFSTSNLLVLFNDRIIHHARNLKPASGDKLKVWLTILEYSEVFIEVSARKLWGEKGKWIVILALQISKCIARLALLVLHKENIIQNPPVPPLKRNQLDKEKIHYHPKYNFNSVTFSLKRSGRLIRRINAAPPIQHRSWKPPVKPLDLDDTDEDDSENSKPPLQQHMYAEILYVTKPIVHLLAMGHWGSRAWKPWIMALGIDLMSLHLYKHCPSSGKINQQKKLEISRRTVALLLYILRSPFYEKYSKDRIQAFLLASSQHLPLVRLIFNPLAQYIPVWQDTYFYTWST